jgi:hypothetical protein
LFGRFFLVIALLLVGLLFVRWFLTTPPEQVARTLRRSALYVGIAVLVLLAAAGRLNWLFAAIAAAIPFVLRALNLVRLLPAVQQAIAAIQRLRSGAGPSPGQVSQIETRYLRMRLDHETGALSGEVLEGPLRGRALDDLDLSDLVDLLGECRAQDPQSARLLEAYLDRMHGDEWREAAGPAGDGRGEGGGGATSGAMTREEAYAVLGLSPGASEEDIKAAHRRLMQKLHPDRGGSGYLAAKINQAKDLLLG